MEHAAEAVARQMPAMCGRLAREKVLVLCGEANSGGDRLAVSRRLLLLPPEALRAVLPGIADSTVAVDTPSDLGSDSGEPLGDSMRAGCTVTFSAPKTSQVLAPSCDRLGDLTVARIGTAESVLASLP